MRAPGRTIIGGVVLYGAIGALIAAAIAQLAGAFGTMGPVHSVGRPLGNVVYPVGNTTVVWQEFADPFRRGVWWQRLLGAGETPGPRTWTGLNGESRMWWRHDARPGTRVAAQVAPPWWSRIGDPREVELVRVQDAGEWDDMRQDYAVGWPWPSFKFECDRVLDPVTGKSAEAPRWAVRVPSRELTVNGIRAFDINFLTWNPIWPGLVASSAFWGLAFFIILMLVGRFVHRCRLAKGLCPKCRYDLRGLAPETVCPECGSASLSVAARPQRDSGT